MEAHFEPQARNSQRPPRAFRAPHETANAPPPRILHLRRKTAPKMKNRSRDPHHALKGVADFAARRRQIILIINRRDMRAAIYSSRAAVHRRGITIPAPFRARQSCQFLETGSLHPPPAALRRFPCASAARALQRSASPSKKEDGEKALPHKDINRIPFMSKARGHQKIW